MGKTFLDMLDLYLTEKENNPSFKAEEIIESVNKRENVDASKTSEIIEECKTLDELSSDYKNLKQSLKDGLSKEEWLTGQVMEVTKDMSNEEIESLQNSVLDNLDAIIERNTSTVAESTIDNTITKTNKKDVTINR